METIYSFFPVLMDTLDPILYFSPFETDRGTDSVPRSYFLNLTLVRKAHSIMYIWN